MNIFDAIGLGAFTVVGIDTAVNAGYGEYHNQGTDNHGEVIGDLVHNQDIADSADNRSTGIHVFF